MNASVETLNVAPQPAVVVEGASKRYGDKMAINNINLTIRQGETVALIGPNGAGKTTLIESIIGLKQLDEGRVRLFGEEVTKKSAKKLSNIIGVQLQETRWFKHWQVKEYIDVFASLFDKSADVEGLIDSLGLRAELTKRIEHLSGGYKQRLSLLLALINSPKVIFLDEPTTGLDPISRKELWKKIEELKSKDNTIILCTHYMEEVRELCDRIVLVSDGQVVANGTAEELISAAPQDQATLDDAFVFYANKCA